MPFRILTLVPAVGAGTAAGVFLAFSTFVMTGLRELPPPQAIGATQAINRAAPRSVSCSAALRSSPSSSASGRWAC